MNSSQRGWSVDWQLTYLKLNAKKKMKTCQMIDFISVFNSIFLSFILISFAIVRSPAFPTRSTYTPSSSNLHYFTNTSPTPESQMWSTTSANNDDYDRPKNGALPDFQRLTNSYYTTNGRVAHINYATQVVSSLFFCIEYDYPFSLFWSQCKTCFPISL